MKEPAIKNIGRYEGYIQPTCTLKSKFSSLNDKNAPAAWIKYILFQEKFDRRIKVHT